MKKMIVLLVAIAASGCTSYVKTYDADGKLTGSCRSRRIPVIGGQAVCNGTAR